MTTAIGSISNSSTQAASFDPTKGAARIAAKVFGELDTDKDGKVSKSDFVTGLESKGVSTDDASKQFDVIDKNKSGSITQSDVETAIKSGTFGPPRPAGGAGGPGGAGGHGDAQGASTSSATKTYEAADTNQDGKVSAQEQLIYDLSHSTQKTSDSSKLGSNINQLA